MPDITPEAPPVPILGQLATISLVAGIILAVCAVALFAIGCLALRVWHHRGRYQGAGIVGGFLAFIALIPFWVIPS